MTDSASPHVSRPVLRSAAAWLPFAALVAYLLASAMLGSAGPVDSAHAAGTITVTGQVDEYIYMDPTNCSAASSLDIGDLVPGDPWKRTPADCAITFGTTNSAAGAELHVLEDPAASASPPAAMKCIATTCTGAPWDGAIDDAPADSAAPAGNASAFGAQLEGTSGVAAPTWTAGSVNPIGADSTACVTTAVGDGACSFRFGAAADTGDGPGAYRAQAQFLVLAV